MKESKFEKEFLDEVRDTFPGCLIIKLDTRDIQGITDRLILWNDYWATLEFKASEDAPRQPNQEYYVDLMNGMSFSAFVYPENAEDVLYDLQRAWQTRRNTRVSRRKQLPLGQLRRG